MWGKRQKEDERKRITRYLEGPQHNDKGRNPYKRAAARWPDDDESHIETSRTNQRGNKAIFAHRLGVQYSDLLRSKCDHPNEANVIMLHYILLIRFAGSLCFHQFPPSARTDVDGE